MPAGKWTAHTVEHPLHRAGFLDDVAIQAEHLWFALLDQAAGLSVRMVQYIGGEPTLHPYLPHFIGRALSLGMWVEVCANLVRIRPPMWEIFEYDGVRLATSYYSNNAAEHEEITGGRGSYACTKANITEAVRHGIPLRASLVHVLDRQDIDGARAELRQLGVTGETRVDRVRAVGNGNAVGLGVGVTFHDPAELCGRCGTDRAAINPRRHRDPVRDVPMADAP
ncbi:radical SAM protein [Streptomyces sp. NPDC101227]|uniref:radical SAM protein n=1 Tax=Streptomyces sp. NPDC101227 TaxID=3366136 RepID=UPI003828292C